MACSQRLRHAGQRNDLPAPRAPEGRASGAGGPSSARLPASGQAGLRVVVRELVGGVLVDEPVVQEPTDGAALSWDVPEGVPRRDQLGTVLIALAFEPAERSWPPEAP